MLANKELREYSGAVRVWVGKYRNLTNLPHWHPDDELIYADKGCATVFIDGNAYLLEEGKSIFISSQVIHHIKADDGSILSFFLFDHKLVREIIADRVLVCPVLSGDYCLLGLYEKINAELSSDGRLKALSINNRIERLMIDLFSNEPTRESAKTDDYLTERYKLLLKDIDERYAEYSLTEAARFTSLSESYFSRFFAKMADMTFTQYLNLVRVEKAIELLRANAGTVTQIAIASGFGTIRNFNRVFKAVTGYSPAALPKEYDVLQIHPSYGVERSFNPTLNDSELI